VFKRPRLDEKKKKRALKNQANQRNINGFGALSSAVVKIEETKVRKLEIKEKKERDERRRDYRG